MLNAQQQATLFSDPKLNAMRQAAVAGNWSKLFQIAPRGCVHRDGVAMPAKGYPGEWVMGQTGVCGDAPHIVPGDPRGKAMYEYWTGSNPLRKAITIQDLRYKKNAQGKIVHVPLTRAEASDFYFNHQWAYHNYGCKDDKLRKWIGRAAQGAEIETWGQCRAHAGEKNWKKVKNVAAAAVAVTGAVFLGPTIGGLAKAGAAKIGAAVTKVGSMASKAIAAVNAGRTVKAIKDGEVPPPPIEVTGDAFKEWALKEAAEEFMESEQRKMTREEEALMEREIAAMQAELARMAPPSTPKTPDPRVSPAVQQIQAAEVQKNKTEASTLKTALLIAAPLALLILTKG